MFTSYRRRFLHAFTLAAAILFAQSANASFHLWQIAEIYSNADGTVQYIELTTSASGQQFLSGHQVTASQNGATHSFTFPANLPGGTSNHKFLIGTQGFASLGRVTPDYVVPNGFLFLPNGSVDFAGVDVVAYAALPSNGVSALDRVGNIVVNAPTNFGGATGTIGAPQAPPQCTLSAIPVVISAGASSTLTANCSPAATSFEWSGGTCTGTTAASCTVTPAATTTYTVAGINASGPGTAISNTVTVSNSFLNNRNNYSITKTSTGFGVTDNVGAGGTVALTGATQIIFADMTVNLLIGDLSKTIPADSLKTLIELYVAFFNRIPNSDGLAYWIGQFNSGMSLDQIAESFYNAGIQYSSLTGFFSGMTPDDFINTVYRNVLGRPDGADQVGMDYWKPKLLDGSATHGSLVTDILFAAHSYKADPTWHWVPDLLDNKYGVANYFCLQQGLNYNTPEVSIAEGMAIAAKVTPTSTAAAINLIGVTDSGFYLTGP